MIKKYLYNKFKKILGDDGSDQDQQTTKSLFNLFLFALLAVIFVFLINLIPLFFDASNPKVDTPTKFGTWGDFFGGVLNPILTFLTFMGLLITIVLQQKEFRLARKEYEEQTDALEKQQVEMVEQTFDNKFFQMLNSFNYLVSSFEHTHLVHKTDGAPKDITVKGKKVFVRMHRNLEDSIEKSIDKSNKDSNYLIAQHIDCYENFNNKYDEIIRYYFINLYQLLRYVDKEASEPKKYTNIIRAQLTNNELLLLFHNTIGITRYGGVDYLKLVEDYELLEHLKLEKCYFVDDTNDLINMTLVSCYNSGAFGKNKGIKRRADHFFKGDTPNLREKIEQGIPKARDIIKKLDDEEKAS